MGFNMDGLHQQNQGEEKQNSPAEAIYLSAIQMNSGVSVEDNLLNISTYLAKITKNTIGQHLVVLPECCLFFGGNDKQQLLLAQSSIATVGVEPHFTATSNNSLVNSLSSLAKQYQVYLVAGTIPILCEDNKQFTNSSLMFNPEGELINFYDKIHLFDVDVRTSPEPINPENKADITKHNNNLYTESTFTKAGDKVKVAKLSFAQVGLTVCFDLRFPLLFNALAQLGADIITVPSAFTRVTGEVHWETLLKARAIENQVYIIASGQEGVHDNGRETWGHSMIISPWGEVLTCLAHGAGYITVPFNPKEISRVRSSMPLKQMSFNK
jgi:predicted amidohydrolase